jgi:putative PIN family toxin of toxin-antitoxin system
MALWREDRFELVISEIQLEELVEVLARPHIRARLNQERSLALLRRLRDDAIWVEGITNASGLPDPDDDFLLAAALESGAEFIVTWDQALREQESCQGVRIVSSDQFASLIVRTT